MNRDWKNMENDEIYGIWKIYLRGEFDNDNPLYYNRIIEKPVRLTPMDIIKLVEELLDRLEIKENEPCGNPG